MKIATWNVNGIKARSESLPTWLAEARPDIACLQEIKCVDELFPTESLSALGYNVAVHGQKGFNGVALLSRHPIEDVVTGLPGDTDDLQARYIEAIVATGDGALRIGGLYLPNGNPVGTDKFTYKLAWMERLHRHARGLLALEMPAILAGDFNVIPEPRDARFPDRWTGDALFQPESRAAFRSLLAQGWTDAIRATAPGEDLYTFWDYQAGAWQKNDGIRIDHVLLSPQAADRLIATGIDKQTRAWEKPSDHVPVWVEIAI
ncbi:MAG: exodeoxyribonuclease III [Hyphomicrobiaceae bacterium]